MMKSADGKPLKMIQKVAAGDYMTFGMLLLQDDNGEEVNVLKRDHIHDGAESVTQAFLIKWLTSGAASTRTYQHLIECLRQSELGALSDNIAEMAGMCIQYCLHVQPRLVLGTYIALVVIHIANMPYKYYGLTVA